MGPMPERMRFSFEVLGRRLLVDLFPSDNNTRDDQIRQKRAACMEHGYAYVAAFGNGYDRGEMVAAIRRAIAEQDAVAKGGA